MLYAERETPSVGIALESLQQRPATGSCSGWIECPDHSAEWSTVKTSAVGIAEENNANDSNEITLGRVFFRSCTHLYAYNVTVPLPFNVSIDEVRSISAYSVKVRKSSICSSSASPTPENPNESTTKINHDYNWVFENESHHSQLDARRVVSLKCVIEETMRDGNTILLSNY